MSPSFADFEQSMRRSPARRRVLLALASMSISYARPLAKAAGVEHQRLLRLLHGHPPQYAEARALVPLGLVRVVEGRNGRAFEITSRGRRKARQLAARGVRAAARKRAVRTTMEGVANTPVPDAGVRAPAAVDTRMCTYTCTVPP